MSPSVEFLRLALRHPLEAALETYNARSSKRRLKLLPRDPAPFYAADGLWTYHGHDFTEDEGFKRAYARAVKAGSTTTVSAGASTRCCGQRNRPDILREGSWSAAPGEGSWPQPSASTSTGIIDPSISTIRLNRPAGTSCGPLYADGPEPVAANFAEWPGVKLIVGKIPETLLDTDLGSGVAFLHIDLNNAPAEEAVLRHFWPRLQPGAR